MTTLLDAPAEPTPAPRHWRRWVAVPAGVVFALAVAGEACAQHYQPLVPGSYSGVGDGTRETDDRGDYVRLPLRPGELASVQVTVRNTGRFAVTVDGVERDDPWTYVRLLKATGLGSSPRTPLQGAVALPHVVEPGEELGLTLVYRLPDCGLTPSTALTLHRFPLRWHALHSDHVTSVEMDRLAFEVPAGYRGPGREQCTGVTYEVDESPDDYLGEVEGP